MFGKILVRKFPFSNSTNLRISVSLSLSHISMSDSEEDAHDRADDSLPSLCAAAKVGDLDRVRAFLLSKSVDVNAPKGGVGKEEEERVCE